MKEDILTYEYMRDVCRVYLDLLATRTEDVIGETARVMNIPRAKVKRILITIGLIKSPLSEEVLKKAAKGVPLQEIAEEYDLSVYMLKNYLPYNAYRYGEALISTEVIQEFGRRNDKRRALRKRSSRPEEQSAVIPSASKHVVEKDGNSEPPFSLVRLHLELVGDLSLKKQRILQQLGGLQHGKSISRDVLLPVNMTLHALHYLIQRAFGWQNSHLHMFYLPDETMNELLRGGVLSWCDLVGVWFRSPLMDESAPFWDDDYEEGSVKNWLRSKYTGPYRTLCDDESYEKCAKDMKVFLRNFQAKQFMVEYRTDEVLVNGQVNEVPVPMGCYAADGIARPRFADRPDQIQGYFAKEMAFEQLPWEVAHSFFDWFDFKQLLERLTIAEVLVLGDRRLGDGAKVEKGKGITDVLLYEYDFGDRWQLKITGSYGCDDLVEDGRVTQEELDAARTAVWKTYRPVCIASDGYNLVDDVGGLSGYVDFLEKLDGKVDKDDDYAAEEKADLRTWARSMGWSKRKNVPRNLL